MLEKAVWSDGPPPGRTRQQRSQWDEVVEACVTKPGKWAIFRDQARSVLAYIRGRYSDPRIVVEGHCYRRDERGRRRVDVWMRWDPTRWSVETDAEGEEVPA